MFQKSLVFAKKAKNNYGLFSNKKLMPKEKSYAKKKKKKKKIMAKNTIKYHLENKDIITKT